MSEPVVLLPGEGEQHRLGGTELHILATSQATAGSFFLVETTIEPDFPGPPLHLHRTLHDMFYVLEGTLTLHLADETIEAPAGSFACIPPGTAHTFSNPRAEPVRLLNMSTPGGFEEYMRALVAASSRGAPPSSEEIGRIASRFDVELV